jgi:hypothetical protein
LRTACATTRDSLSSAQANGPINRITPLRGSTYETSTASIFE